MRRLVFILALLFISLSAWSQEGNQQVVRKGMSISVSGLTNTIPVSSDKVYEVTINIFKGDLTTYGQLQILKSPGIQIIGVEAGQGKVYKYPNLVTVVWQPLPSSKNLSVKYKFKFSNSTLPPKLEFQFVFGYFKNGKYGQVSYSLGYNKHVSTSGVIYMLANQ